MEWKPTFVKGGKEEPVGLLQICSGNKVLLIQVSAMKGKKEGNHVEEGARLTNLH
jgi:hypothetical protein